MTSQFHEANSPFLFGFALLGLTNYVEQVEHLAHAALHEGPRSKSTAAFRISAPAPRQQLGRGLGYGQRVTICPYEFTTCRQPGVA